MHWECSKMDVRENFCIPQRPTESQTFECSWRFTHQTWDAFPIKITLKYIRPASSKWNSVCSFHRLIEKYVCDRFSFCWLTPHPVTGAAALKIGMDSLIILLI